MKINVYCRNLGWLFQDLQSEIASFGAIPSEKPLPDMDAYICIRTKESELSPKPSKTVVQVHDMDEYDLRGFGMVSLCYPAQSRKVQCDNSVMIPIGARDIDITPFPDKKTLGFFCREVKGSKGSVLFEESVKIARESIDFDVLMVGKNLDHISHLGKYESRAAIPKDYARITAFFTANPVMVALSAYEALAAGRSVVTTPREWPFDAQNIFTGRNPKELAQAIILALDAPSIPQKPFCRTEWARKQVSLARELCLDIK